MIIKSLAPIAGQQTMQHSGAAAAGTMKKAIIMKGKGRQQAGQLSVGYRRSAENNTAIAVSQRFPPRVFHKSIRTQSSAVS